MSFATEPEEGGEMTHPVFGTESEFMAKYGETTPDGTPRSGDDYAFLHHPSELTNTDRKRTEDNPFRSIADAICDLGEWSIDKIF